MRSTSAPFSRTSFSHARRGRPRWPPPPPSQARRRRLPRQQRVGVRRDAQAATVTESRGDDDEGSYRDSKRSVLAMRRSRSRSPSRSPSSPSSSSSRHLRPCPGLASPPPRFRARRLGGRARSRSGRARRLLQTILQTSCCTLRRRMALVRALREARPGRPRASACSGLLSRPAHSSFSFALGATSARSGLCRRFLLGERARGVPAPSPRSSSSAFSSCTRASRRRGVPASRRRRRRSRRTRQRVAFPPHVHRSLSGLARSRVKSAFARCSGSSRRRRNGKRSLASSSSFSSVPRGSFASACVSFPLGIRLFGARSSLVARSCCRVRASTRQTPRRAQIGS